MEEQASQVLAILKRSSVSPDQKLTHLNTLKSTIKHQRVPEAAQATTVECVRFAVSTNLSSALVTTGFSTLGHLIKRLSLQEQVGALFGQRAGIEKALLERLGDQREGFRNAASQCLGELWSARPETVERIIRENAISGTHVRAKEAGMAWVARMHTDHQLQFRNFVPHIVECLDHADGTVRECAKLTLVDLFKNASDRAKADLKKQLAAQNIRHSIASFILSQVNMPGHSDSQASAGAPTLSTTHQPKLASRSATPSQEPRLPDTGNGAEPSLPPSAEATNIEPLYVASSRELEDLFRSMQPCFEGKEDEGNWKIRDTNVLKLRRLNKGNAPQDYLAIFIAGIKTLLEGILKVVNSLRTTMSTNGCQLVQELARHLGPSLDSMVEILLQNLIKMTSATKHISAQNGNLTVETIFSHVSYNTRLMQHIFMACQDKNVSPRIYAAGWVKIIIKRQAHSKSAFEHSGGLDLADKSIRKGLADANPKVRESMRSTYWAFTAVWPDKGEAIMDTLDPKSKQLLAKDPANPSKPSEFSSSVGPGGKTGNPRAAASKPSIRDAIAAQRKAALAVSRPNSAMADLSPVKQPAPAAARHLSALTGRTGSRPGSSGKGASGASATGQGSLMSGPMRRPRKPDVPRPQTADPMHNNQKFLNGDDTPSTRSPVTSPARPVSKSSATSSTSSHSKSKSATSIHFGGQVGSPSSSRTSTPKTSPIKSRPKSYQAGTAATAAKSAFSPSSSSQRGDYGSSKATPLRPHTSTKHSVPRPASNHSSFIEQHDDEDNFTLVMPQRSDHGLNGATKSRSHVQSLAENNVEEDMEAEDETIHAASRPVSVYEDPETSVHEQHTRNGSRPTALEELPVNEQNTGVAQPTSPMSPGPNPDERPISPSKRAAFGADRSADAVKNHRLLISGIQRVRARTLDAHGLRRLQDVIKSGASDSSSSYAELLSALMDYIDQPPEAINTNATKAQSLKLQALTNLRTLITTHRNSPAVAQGYPEALRAVILAKRLSDGTSAHISGELDKTADEIVRNGTDRIDHCIDEVFKIAEIDIRPHMSKSHGVLPMALNVLSKLLAQKQRRHEAITGSKTQRLGHLAVRCLDDTDADVRRAATEFCLQFRACFEPGGKGNTAFWDALGGVREAQANLVAYYIARRGFGGQMEASG